MADAAVFGVPESTKGQIPLCLYVVKNGVSKTPTKLSVELISLIREVIGPIAAFRLVGKVENLPRTRSGIDALLLVDMRTLLTLNTFDRQNDAQING